MSMGIDCDIFYQGLIRTLRMKNSNIVAENKQGFSFHSGISAFEAYCVFALVQEVLAFQRFLQETGGHTGGWAEEDHLLFLHLRKKHKGKITFLNLLKEQLPGKLQY